MHKKWCRTDIYKGQKVFQIAAERHSFDTFFKKKKKSAQTPPMVCYVFWGNLWTLDLLVPGTEDLGDLGRPTQCPPGLRTMSIRTISVSFLKNRHGRSFRDEKRVDPAKLSIQRHQGIYYKSMKIPGPGNKLLQSTSKPPSSLGGCVVAGILPQTWLQLHEQTPHSRGQSASVNDCLIMFVLFFCFFNSLGGLGFGQISGV